MMELRSIYQVRTPLGTRVFVVTFYPLTKYPESKLYHRGCRLRSPLGSHFPPNVGYRALTSFCDVASLNSQR
jgi:hypothetical protein